MRRAILIKGSAAVLAFWPASTSMARDLRLSPDQVSQLEIKVEAVRPASSELVAILPATVVRPPNAHIVATAPYAGTVTQVLVLPGQQVSAGELIARVSSRDLLEAQSQLAQAQAELQNAEAIARRLRTLANKQLKSEFLAEEAEAQVAKVQAVVDRHKGMLELNGIVAGEGGQYAIPATHDGVVAQIDVMPGDKIESMAAVVSLDSSEDLWAEVQVPASVVAKIKPGDAVKLPDGEEGRVLSVGTVLDAKTRSAIMYVELPKAAPYLPGEMISLSLMRAVTAQGFSVPARAVARIDNQVMVFVRTENGFTAQPVDLLAKSQSFATISGNLPADAQVASSGIPQLEQLLAGN